MALEDGDYGGAFSTNPYLDPAMGRIFAENPEAMIPHLVEAGVTPQQFEQQLPKYAANFDTRFDASYPPPINMGGAQTPFIPDSGVVGRDQNALSFAPGEQPREGGILGSIRRGYEKATAPPGTSGPNPYMQPSVPLPPPRPEIPTPAKPQDRVAESGPGAVPPTALGQSPDTGEEPYTPSPQYARVTGGTGEAIGDTAALPTRDPRKAAAEDYETSDAAKYLGALAGVRAPPAPPQPQLRPFAGERPGTIPQSGLVALLAQAIAGDPRAQALRLGQAVGGR